MTTWYCAGPALRKTASEDWSHGSGRLFNSFFDRYGQHGDPDDDTYDVDKHWNTHIGPHFTSDHETADQFAADNGGDDGGHVYHVNLKMQNPKHYGSEFDMDKEAWHHAAKQRKIGPTSPLRNSEPDTPNAYWEDLSESGHGDTIAQSFKQHLIRQGHDGITYGNEHESPKLHKCAIPFHGHQVEITHTHLREEPCAEHDSPWARARQQPQDYGKVSSLDLTDWYAYGSAPKGKTASWSHGSEHDFDKFSMDGHPDMEGDDDKHWNTHIGPHFTSLHSVAEQFSDKSGWGGDKYPGHVYHVGLDMKNPKHYDSEHDMDKEAHELGKSKGLLLCNKEHGPGGHADCIRDYSEEQDDYYSEPAGPVVAEAFKNHLHQQGHDGITYGNEHEGPKRHKCAIAFGEHQIKVHSQHAANQVCPEGEDDEDSREDKKPYQPAPIPGQQKLDFGKFASLDLTEFFKQSMATNWDEHYDKIPDEIHRGLFAPESSQAFGAPASDHDIAHMLIHAHQEEQFGHHKDRDKLSGVHWTTDENVARDFAKEHEEAHHTENVNECDHEDHHSATPVVFHAEKPAHHEIEHDERRIGWQNIYDHDHAEKEVPIGHGQPVRIKGVSWRTHEADSHFGEMWHRHDLDEPVTLHAHDEHTPDDENEWNGNKPEDHGKMASLNSEDELPPEPGTTSIPDGHIRLYHYTRAEHLPGIKEHGLLESHARGDGGMGAGNEPSAGVWASTKPPKDAPNFVEFHAHPDEISDRASSMRGYTPEEFGKGNHHVIMRGDVKPHQIVNIHEKWHDHARYIMGSPDVLEATKRGENDSLEDDPDYAKAITHVKKHGAVDSIRLYHGTNRNSWDSMNSGGERESHEDLSHRIEQDHDLPHDSVWKHPWVKNGWTGQRAKDGKSKDFSTSMDYQTAKGYAQVGSAPLHDMLQATYQRKFPQHHKKGPLGIDRVSPDENGKLKYGDGHYQDWMKDKINHYGGGGVVVHYDVPKKNVFRESEEGWDIARRNRLSKDPMSDATDDLHGHSRFWESDDAEVSFPDHKNIRPYVSHVEDVEPAESISSRYSDTRETRKSKGIPTHRPNDENTPDAFRTRQQTASKTAGGYSDSPTTDVYRGVYLGDHTLSEESARSEVFDEGAGNHWSTHLPTAEGFASTDSREGTGVVLHGRVDSRHIRPPLEPHFAKEHEAYLPSGTPVSVHRSDVVWSDNSGVTKRAVKQHTSVEHHTAAKTAGGPLIFYPAKHGGKYHLTDSLSETARCRGTVEVDKSGEPIHVSHDQEKVHPIVCKRCLDSGRAAQGQGKHVAGSLSDYTMHYGVSDLGHHVVDAMHNGQDVGTALFDPDGTLADIHVNREHRRKGLATAMWEHAKKSGIKPQHSNVRSRQGDAWAKSTKDHVPANVWPHQQEEEGDHVENDSFSTAFTAPGYHHPYTSDDFPAALGYERKPHTAALHNVTYPQRDYNDWSADDDTKAERDAAHQQKMDHFHKQVKQEAGLPEDSKPHELHSAWERGIRHGLTQGHITIDQAEQQGHHGDGRERGTKYRDYGDDDTPVEKRHGGWQNLAANSSHYFHVGTDADAIKEEGLKTRHEQNHTGSSTGLGGGSDDTVSVTDDGDLPHDIYHSLHEHHAVLKGKITPQQLHDYAKNPPHGEPFHHAIVKPGSPEEGNFDRLKRGVISNHNDYVPEDKGPQNFTSKSKAAEEHPGWTPVEESRVKGMEKQEAEGREPEYTHWERPVTHEEHTRKLSEFYKRFSHSRDMTGKGHRDPLFMSNNPIKFAKTDPEKFGIMTLKPHPKAQGYPLDPDRKHHKHADSGEWRLGSGSPFEVTHIAKPYPRHLEEFENYPAEKKSDHGKVAVLFDAAEFEEYYRKTASISDVGDECHCASCNSLGMIPPGSDCVSKKTGAATGHTWVSSEGEHPIDDTEHEYKQGVPMQNVRDGDLFRDTWKRSSEQPFLRAHGPARVDEDYPKEYLQDGQAMHLIRTERGFTPHAPENSRMDVYRPKPPKTASFDLVEHFSLNG